MRLVVLGAGFLGTRLANRLLDVADVFVATLNPDQTGMTGVDALDLNRLSEYIGNVRPEVVISTVALASYYKCEENRDMCFSVNYQANKNILDVCKSVNARMAYISSSYIFDGRVGNYSEGDLANPQGNYAKSKLLAENYILQESNSIIFRLDCLYGYDAAQSCIRVGGNTFRSRMNVAFPDIIRTPIFIDDAVDLVSKVLHSGRSGVFNLAGERRLTWLKFLNDLAQMEGLEGNIYPDDPGNWIVHPPKDTSLNIQKIRQLGYGPRSYEESLKILRLQVGSSNFGISNFNR